MHNIVCNKANVRAIRPTHLKGYTKSWQKQSPLYHVHRYTPTLTPPLSGLNQLKNIQSYILVI